MPGPDTKPAAADTPGPVLLFDGECGLCQRVVRLLLRLDRVGRLHFAPLQGRIAQAYLRRHGLPTEDFDTIILVPDWGRRDRRDFLVRTNGVVAALRECGLVGRMLAAGVAVWPERWRDAMYRAIARLRYRVFGPWQPRPLARAEWVRRFLE